MRNQTIVCISTRIWDSLWRSCQQVMSRIAVDNHVLYFEPGRNPDRPMAAELRRNMRYFFTAPSRQNHENLTIIPSPSSIPYASLNLPRSVLQLTTPLVASINARVLIGHVRRVLRAQGVTEPILWLYEPRHIDLVGKFSEKLVCYYNYDEMSEFARNARIKHLLRHYDNRLSARADVVFATSRGQTERRKQLNPHTYLIPNGVDFDLFNKALEASQTVASDIAALKPPIIGYVGWMGYQLDAELFVRVAERFRECSLALVGPDCLPEGPAKQRLHAMPNVFFLGQKPLYELPSYLKAIDVALIPYAIGGHTLTVYPLKLHEYLAAGRAVVATALPELEPFADVVRIGRSHEEYLAHVSTVLREGSSDTEIAARVDVARTNTWDARVAAIHRVLDAHPRLRDAQARPSQQPVSIPVESSGR